MPNEAEQFTQEADDKTKIKTEIKQEHDPDSTDPVPVSNFVKIEPLLTDPDQIKSEPPSFDDEDVGNYFISTNDLKKIGAVVKDEIKGESIVKTFTNKSDNEKGKGKRATPKICPYCSLEFPNSKNFKRHVMNHTDERPFQCGLCDSKFKGKYHLTVHIKTHTGERNIPCPDCDKSFIVQSALRAHMRTHSKEKPYVCHICGRGFSHQANLKPHISTHSEGLPFECEECGERVRDRKGLLKHMRLHHVDCKIEGCDFCSKFNKDSEKTLKELQRRMWKCPYCVEAFKYYPTYKNHVKTHNNESFSCNYCDKTYLNIAYLRIHMRNHTGETPFECSSCGKKFKRKDSLKYHLSTHNEERKLFPCDVCHQGYTHRSSLFKHKREIHSIIIEKFTVSCRVCEEKLEERAYRVHMKKHGLQVFKCRKCKGYIEGEEVFEMHKKTKCVTTEESFSEAVPTEEMEDASMEEFEKKVVKMEES